MAKRRPSGDGMVRKKEDGRWEGRIVVGHKQNGEPIFRYVLAKTQKEFETLCLPYGCQKVVLTSGENGYGIPELQAVLDAAIAAEYKENAEDAE